MGFLCLTIDLDEVRCYEAIHGLAPGALGAPRLVYERALPRVARFLAELGVTGTLFVVGRDLAASPAAGQLVADLARRGHEIANHTGSHPYALTGLDAAGQAREIDDGAEAIRGAIGQGPRGFRAPGYNTHAGLHALLRQRGYLYDSSVFPCPLYHAAKDAVIGWRLISGRPSASVIADPRMLLAPRGPYRAAEDNAFAPGEGGLVELPITVVGRLGWPLIGAALALAGRSVNALALREARRLPFVNVELHGLDFLDAHDGLEALVPGQPDLRVPLDRKRDLFERFLKGLLDAGHEPIPLDEAVPRLFP